MLPNEDIRFGVLLSSLDRKLLQVFVIFDVRVDGVTDYLCPFFAELFKPLAIFVMITLDLLLLTAANVSTVAYTYWNRRECQLTWSLGFSAELCIASSWKPGHFLKASLAC